MKNIPHKPLCQFNFVFLLILLTLNIFLQFNNKKKKNWLGKEFYEVITQTCMYQYIDLVCSNFGIESKF